MAGQPVGAPVAERGARDRPRERGELPAQGERRAQEQRGAEGTHHHASELEPGRRGRPGRTPDPRRHDDADEDHLEDHPALAAGPEGGEGEAGAGWGFGHGVLR